MKTTAYIAASSALMAALLISSPALADSNHGSDHADKSVVKSEGHMNLNFGSLVSFFNKNKHNDGNQDVNDNDQDNDHDGNNVQATSTAQTNITIAGTVTAISGSTITLNNDGHVFTVSTASTTIFSGMGTTTVTFSTIKVGDRIVVNGTLSGSIITALSIKDNGAPRQHPKNMINEITAGVVSSINGLTLTINPFGGHSTTTVVTNASTTFAGGATSSNSLAVGSDVIVAGTSSTSTPDTITATFVILLNNGLSFLSHLFSR